MIPFLWHFKQMSIQTSVKKANDNSQMYLTCVEIGVETQIALLYVKGEGVDVKVTGTDNFDW